MVSDSNVSYLVADLTQMHNNISDRMSTPAMQTLLGGIDVEVHVHTHTALGVHVKLSIGWGMLG
jgi:hypothetical protein